ncbi:MAG: ribose 5-phosphate isomerase B [Spirochaetales bacterium]|nr:ribose 5-phosphate isomerase B [Spirochaetales bacterium]
MENKIIIGSDHGGFDLKQEIIAFLQNDMKYEVQDMGCYDKNSVDYPDIAETVCNEVKKSGLYGILICGTGIGISISANKINGIRCALCSDEYSAKMTRHHNDANVLALGGRTVGPELAKSIVQTFLTNDFDGGRHEKRVNKIKLLEEKQTGSK